MDTPPWFAIGGIALFAVGMFCVVTVVVVAAIILVVRRVGRVNRDATHLITAFAAQAGMRVLDDRAERAGPSGTERVELAWRPNPRGPPTPVLRIGLVLPDRRSAGRAELDALAPSLVLHLLDGFLFVQEDGWARLSPEHAEQTLAALRPIAATLSAPDPHGRQ